MPQRTADKLATHSAYSYRNDPNVPPFPDDHPVIVHDGVCVLCSRSMRIIARGDRAGRFRFMSAQSATGQALYKHYDLDAQDFETVLLIESGRVYGKLDMIQHVAGQLSGPYLLFSALAVMRLLPGRATLAKSSPTAPQPRPRRSPAPTWWCAPTSSPTGTSTSTPSLPRQETASTPRR